MNRRRLLAWTGLALSTGTAGCSTLNSLSSTRSVSVQTPTAGECEPNAEFRPTPDAPDRKQYPTLPTSLRASSAEAFASDFERAFRYNSRLPEYESVQVDVTVPGWAVSETDDGFVVGLDGRVQFDDTETPTETTPFPSGFIEYSVWYYLTDRFALRGEPSNDALKKSDSPALTGAVTVACAGTED